MIAILPLLYCKLSTNLSIYVITFVFFGNSAHVWREYEEIHPMGLELSQLLTIFDTPYAL